MMNERISEQRKIDPSNKRQVFNDINIKLLCCRYWFLHEWDCVDLSAPFWRIYHNELPGAKITFRDDTVYLSEKEIVIIPPHTSFSTHLKYDTLTTRSESIIGRRIELNDFTALAQQNKIDHLFIHFNLGFPLDFVKSGIYCFDCDEKILDLLKTIKKSCIDEYSAFQLTDYLMIQQLIILILLKLQPDIWKFGNIDYRIFNAMRHIEKHLNEKISNEDLADQANLAINSFARLFKLSTGITIQQYILKKRIEKSCDLMHHTKKTIDEISYDCGFSDRYHFSKIFKQVMGISPAYYKKHLILE